MGKVFKLVDLGKEFPGLLGLFFVNLGDGKAGMHQNNVAYLDVAQKGRTGFPLITQGIHHRSVLVQLNNPCRYC